MSEAKIKEEKLDELLSDDEELNKILEDVAEEADVVLPTKVAAQPPISEDFLNELDEEENRIIKSLDSDVVVKQEASNGKDNDEPQQVSVKKEKDSQPVADDTQLSETFLAELDKEVQSLASPSADDADIQMLQELIAKRKRELGEIDETMENAGRSGSKSSNLSSAKVSNKRKADEQRQGATENTQDGNQTRKRQHVDEASSSGAQTQNKSAVSSRLQTDPSANQSTAQLDSQASEQELERLLKADDSDEDLPLCQPDELLPNVAPTPVYGFPNTFQMGAPMFDPGIQMMGGMQPPGYPMMYNMGMQPAYYPPNMGGMPMMGYGMPHMPVNEVECLPVMNNAGFSGMPSFKRIKLEKTVEVPKEDKDESQISAEERRRKVLEACSILLEQLEFSEPSGKFTFTPTVTKLTVAHVSNSIVQKISNVSYDFHSIGPKQNISDWGLKEIGSRNCDIAKKIGISADKYFLKIAEKADTIARKLIKVEDSKTDATEDATEEEVEEPTLSTFLKNSMTQTDKLVCADCAARKRKVGHNIACQATVYTGSVGSQTSPELNDDNCLSEGLNENQLKALYEFSSLIREPPKNTVIELNRLRERLIIIYNLSQRKNKQPLPNVSLTDEFSRAPVAYNALGGQRTEGASNNISNRFLPPGRQMQNVSHSLPHPMQEARNPDSPQNIQVLQNRQMPVINTHQHPGTQFPRDQQSVPSFFRGQQPASAHAYQQSASQIPRMVPAPNPLPVSGHQQRPVPGPQIQRGQQSAPRYPGHKMPSLQDPRRQPSAEQGARKGFGRGNQR